MLGSRAAAMRPLCCFLCSGRGLMARVGTRNKGTGHGRRATRSPKLASVQPAADGGSAGDGDAVPVSADPELGQPHG